MSAAEIVAPLIMIVSFGLDGMNDITTGGRHF